MPRRVLVLDLVSLTPDLLRRPEAPTLRRLAAEGAHAALAPPFPAVTCTAQATLTTGLPPARHGIVANGWFDRERHATHFWEQSAALVQAPRTWDVLKSAQPGATAAAMFLQQSLYAPGLDAVLSPRPLHGHGGMVPWVHGKPPGLYEGLAPDTGPFPLGSYWGPGAGLASTRWIVDAAARALPRLKPTLAYVYLPHLDYDRLRHGPSSPQAAKALAELDAEVARLLDALQRSGSMDNTALVVLGEYAFRDVARPVHLNLALREAGLLQVRAIRGQEYLDMELSTAFAVADHQAAHVYVRDAGAVEKVREMLRAVRGVERVLGPEQLAPMGAAHPRGGELVAVAERDAWFTWRHWERDERAPPNARAVDVHGKHGFDPLELFADGTPDAHGHARIAADASLVKGSHGRPASGPEDRVSVVVHGADAPGLRGARTLGDVHGLVLDLLGARQGG